jgi:4-amino-4-deoxy-L-arabinose transferase-like glycosyltransferase
LVYKIIEKYNIHWLNSSWLWALILIGIALRFYFQIGHIFSDDAYYSYLSHTLVSADFADNYLGYPVFTLRIVHLALTSFSFKIFGINEFATVFFPFIFSILSLILTYKLTLLLTKNTGTALTSTFLMTFFPTDVIFASINFPDLINLFFINLGVYFLLKSFYNKNSKTAILGGISFLISMQIKENIYYVLILLIIILLYLLIKQKQLNFQITIGLLFIGTNVLLEGFIYFLLHNDFFYRFTITSLNYQYSFYDFFPYTAQKTSGSKNYLKNLFDQIVLINGKSIFLRRFYLFLPIIASIQSLFNYRKKDEQLLNFWFWGLVILSIAFTTSFTEFKPLDLQRSWYIFPIVMPMVILSGQFINRFKKSIKITLLIIYTAGSLIMCHQYEMFFDKENLDSLKTFLIENTEKTIYADHFTKYSVDLIRSYEHKNSSERILGKDFDFTTIKIGDWILYNKKHIEELEMQKYEFPDFSVIDSEGYKKVASYNDFIFYEKIIQ